MTMPLHPAGFECRQCGACCRAYVQATERDLYRWAAQFRGDILRYVSAEGLIEPVEGMEGPCCPFLEKLPRTGKRCDVYVCLIHDTKPEACVRFPASREQAVRLGCMGME
jgi:Fe-S-cluster containining protein